MIRTSIAALAAALPLVWGSSVSAALVAPADPCALIGKADAGKAIGKPVVSVKAGTAGPTKTCTLRANGVFRSVVVTAYRWDSPAEAATAFRSIIAQTEHFMQPSKPLHGVGDDAQVLASTVYARKGAAAWVFNVIDGTAHPNPQLEKKTIALAKATLAHVKG